MNFGGEADWQKHIASLIIEDCQIMTQREFIIELYGNKYAERK